jgi:NAD(P)H-hydrate epimerase
MRVLTAAQMREADRRTIQDIGIPSIVLMETAGRQVVSAMDAAFADLADARVAVLAGRGNNGGDGFVVARTLIQRGVEVEVYLVGSSDEVRGDARINLDVLRKLELDVVSLRSPSDWELHAPRILSADLIVDAMIGTGLSEPLTGLHEQIVDDVNDVDVPVVAIDLPSGLSSDTPDPIGPHIFATMTVTLAAPKFPLVLPPSQPLCGSLVVADIGIPRHVLADLPGPRVEVLEAANLRALVPEREPDTHKGTYGHVLLVAGSRGKTGAAHLAALGALRSGAGLVTVATPVSCQRVVASLGAEYMTMAVDEDGDGAFAASALGAILAAPASVVAVGPGIGTGAAAAALVDGLLHRCPCPLILDADALTVLAGSPPGRWAPSRPVIVTPHPGEMARFAGLTVAEVQGDRLGVARSIAERHGVYVVLKGHRTIVAAPDGRAWINGTGNPGMATGGSGDVLTGMLAGWLTQVSDAAQASCLAVHLHGAAGDRAADRVSEMAMTAGDIAAHIGGAVLALTQDQPTDGES